MTKDTTESYTKDKRSAVGWAAGVLATLALTLGGWAHTTLWAHENRLTTLEAKRIADDIQTTSMEARWDKQLAEIKETMRRIEDKLDKRQ